MGCDRDFEVPEVGHSGKHGPHVLIQLRLFGVDGR